MNDIEIKFKCKCQQEYSQDSFNIAVFLYGIFFLIGNEYGYAGITCPSCLKTIAHEGTRNQIEFLRKSLSSPIEFQNFQFDLNLRYHSSVNYFPKNVRAHKDINIHFFEDSLPTDLNDLHSEIISYEDDAGLYENYFRTYAFDDEPPMGSFLSIGWFEKDWIDDFIQIENEKSLRIFPRYVPRNSVYEDIERFCWENYIYLIHLQEQTGEAEDNVKNLKEFLDANLGIITPNAIERMKNQFSEYASERNFKMATDFMAILAADPSPVDLPFPENAPLNYFWKTIHPFRNREIPKTLIDFDSSQFEKARKGPNHKEMARLVKASFKKSYVQNFILENHTQFIKEYIEKAQKIDYSYAAVWKLKEKYLEELYDLVKSKQAQRPDQKARLRCRKVAKRIWDEEELKGRPITTMADMIFDNEIAEACEGITYAENTIRNWIKDLCPDRSPGRRPKKQKK